MKTNQFILSAKMKNIMNVRTWHALSLRMLLLLIFIPAMNGFSQEVAGSDNLTSIESILNSEFNPDDARWDSKFRMGGFDGYIEAIAITPNGNIYVGGDFDLLNGDMISGIAMWDGADWHPLGKGVSGGWRDGIVYAITTDGDNIYVGGDFTEAGEIQANNIAKWDGQNWSALGDGMNADVHAIAVDGDNVYAGGYHISEAGGVTVNNIAKWDGQNWSAMGNGVYNNNYVFAIAANNDTVYAGGSFLEAGEDTVNYIAYWDGYKWNDMDGGMSGWVFALEYEDGLLYAGGSFQEAGGDTVNNIAQWNGIEWMAVGKGVNSQVFSIVAVNGNLYFGGDFRKADTIDAKRIVKWDGQKWNAFAGGFSSRVNAIAVKGDDVYAGGEFREVDGKEEKYLAQWDGQNWSGLGKIQDQSVDGEVFAIAINGNDVYVGGLFTKAGGDTVNNIAKWDGVNWSALGPGLNGKVTTIVVDSGNVYVGGAFSFAGDLPVSRIAKWDGESWSSLGNGMNGWVYAIAVHGDDIYAGGSFTSAGDIWAMRIARWDGLKWYALGGDGSLDGAGGIGGWTYNYVKSIKVYRDTIYVGGTFGRAFYQDGFVRAKSIVKWDGEQWHAVGSFGNVNGQIITSLSVDNGIIYAAGKFPRAGLPQENKVVRWDGVEWSDVGDEMYHTANSSTGGKLNSLAVVDGKIYVAGEFNLVGDKTVNYIAGWDGQEWVSLGNGVNDYVFSLAADSMYLYAGGRFKIAGDKGSSRLGRYNISGAVGVSDNIVNIPEKYSLYQNYPNPFNPATTINYELPINNYVELNIYNLLGQKIETLVSERQPAGKYNVEWRADRIASGMYIYRIKTDHWQAVKKMVLIR